MLQRLPVILLCKMKHVAEPGKPNRALTEALTAETANSTPRETQLITKATTPNKHTLWRRGGDKFNRL